LISTNGFAFQLSTFNPLVLKKSVLILVVLAIGVVSFGSCRSSESCPAYGKVEVPAADAENA
jgi:hypothetical protein